MATKDTDGAPTSMSGATGNAAVGPTSPPAPVMTLQQKHEYAHHADRAIPIHLVAAEFHHTNPPCYTADTPNKNCKHNIHCLHGLGYMRRGIWDGMNTDGKAAQLLSKGTIEWLDLLGTNPQERAKGEELKVGLQNLGATCYLNTLFQFLFMDPTFRRAIYHYEQPKTIPSQSQLAQVASTQGNAAPIEPTEPYLHHLQQIFANLEHSKLLSYTPTHMVNALKLSHLDQQDVHEFLNLLVFQLFDKELQQSASPICRAVIPKLFTGQIVNVMEGAACKHQSERPSEFHDLSSIQIKGKKRLEECLDEYFKPEVMTAEKEEHRWRCGTCGKRETAYRHTYIKSPPPILILQLGRFEFDFQTLAKKKLGDSIWLPKLLDLSKYMRPPVPGGGLDQPAAAAPSPPAAATSAEAAPATIAAAPAPMPAPAADAPVYTSTDVPLAPKQRRGRKNAEELPPELQEKVAFAMEVEEKAVINTQLQVNKPAGNGKRKRGSDGERSEGGAAEVSAAAAAAAAVAGVPVSSLSGLTVKPVPRPSPAPAVYAKRRSTGAPSKAGRAAAGAVTGGRRGRKPRNNQQEGRVVEDEDAGEDEEMNGDDADVQELDPATAGAIDLTEDNAPPDMTAPPTGASRSSRVTNRSPIHAPPPEELRHVHNIVSNERISRHAPGEPVASALQAGSGADLQPLDVKQTALDEYAQPTVAQPQPQAQPVLEEVNVHERPLSARPTRRSRTAAQEEMDAELAKRLEAEMNAPPRAPSKRAAAAAKKKEEQQVVEIEDEEPARKKQKPVAKKGAKKRGAAEKDAASIAPKVPDPPIDPDGPNTYELVAILSHKGTSANRGHYTAEIKDQVTGRWYTFDDSKVVMKKLKTPAATAATQGAEGVKSNEEGKEQTAEEDIVMIDAVATVGVPTASPIVEYSPPTTTGAAPTSSTDPASSNAMFIDETNDTASVTSATANPGSGRGRKRTSNTRGASPAAEQGEAKRAKLSASAKAEDEQSVNDLTSEGANADEEEKPAEEQQSKGKGKKGGAKGGKKVAAGTAGSKKKSGYTKADVSAAAESTAYILIYRRRNTMAPDWNPFTEEEALLEIEKANAMLVDNQPTKFSEAKAPQILMDTIRKENEKLEIEYENYQRRKERLIASVRERQQEVEAFISAPPPSEFKEIAVAMEMLQTTQSNTPKSELSPTRKLPRRAAAAAAVAKKDSSDSASLSSTPPLPLSVDLKTLQFGHYVSTAWLAAYLKGWVYEEDPQLMPTLPTMGKEGKEKEGKEDQPKEEAKEGDDAANAIDVDEGEPAASSTPTTEQKSEAKAEGAAPNTSDDAAIAAAAVAEVPTSTNASSASPLQKFLKEHPDNEEVPWPGDIIEAVEGFKCSHGRLNPRTMQFGGLKRISCQAWKVLYEGNQRWKASQAAKEDEVKVVEKKEQEDVKMKTEKGDISTDNSTLSVKMPASSSPPQCPLDTCNLPGFTDADLCQECARDALLGATILTETWEAHMKVYNAYVEWDARMKEREKETGNSVSEGFMVSKDWWKTWKKELDAAAKALNLTPIAASKTKKKTPAPLSASAMMAQQLKPLPKIHTDTNATKVIRCDHGFLHPIHPGILVPKEVWNGLQKLFPSSQPVAILGLDEQGEPITCEECRKSLEQNDERSKSAKEELKRDKGQMKFIKTISSFQSFPKIEKPPNEGAHFILPTSWVLKLFYYLQRGVGRPNPLNTTTDLICHHGKLKFAPYPEPDRSVMPIPTTPTMTPMAAPATANATAPAAATANGDAAAPPTTSATPAAAVVLSSPSLVALSPLAAIKLHSTPPGEITICTDKEYYHLRERGFIAPESTEIRFNVRPNKAVLGDPSTWAGIEVSVNPDPCDECIRERVLRDETAALEYNHENFTVFHVKSKVEDEVVNVNAMSEGRRASTRTRKPRDRKDVNVSLSSSDTIYTVKLKIFEQDSTPTNHQDIYWVKPDQSVVKLDDVSRTLREYGVPSNAELRVQLNAVGTQDEYDQFMAKGQKEHGFKGTALSGAHTLPAASGNAAANAPAAGAAAPASSTTPPPAATSEGDSPAPSAQQDAAPAAVPTMAPPAPSPAPPAALLPDPLSPTIDSTPPDSPRAPTNPSEPSNDNDDVSPMEIDGATSLPPLVKPSASPLGMPLAATQPILCPIVAQSIPDVTSMRAQPDVVMEEESKSSTPAFTNSLFLAPHHPPPTTDLTLSQDDDAEMDSPPLPLAAVQPRSSNRKRAPSARSKQSTSSNIDQ